MMKNGIGLILLILLASLPCAYGFGISYEYLENNTLRLYPGQNYAFKLTIQNKDPEWVRVNISVNSTFVKLVGGPVLDIPGETFDHFVYFNITVPEDAEIGSSFSIQYVVLPMETEEGQIPLKVRYNRDLPVIIVEPPEALVSAELQPLKTLPFYERRYFVPTIAVLLAIILLAATGVVLWKKFGPAVNKEKTPRLSPKEYFVLRDGEYIKDLEDLVKKLRYMDDNVFKHHVTKDRNDFADWVLHSIKNEKLATALRNKTREEMFKLIEDETNR